jgi:hypothetical protein
MVLSTLLVLLVSGSVCYLAIVNYVTKELHRGTPTSLFDHKLGRIFIPFTGK